MEKVNSFEILNNINVSDKIKQKIGLSYLSWADAWGTLKKTFPDASYKIYTRVVHTTTTEVAEDPNFHTTKTVVYESDNEVPYFTDGKTCYVQVGVTINDVEYVEYLPVMDNRNNAIALAAVTMTAVNKAIQRAFVKACARHGLGLYIYAGEDLPESDRKQPIEIDYNSIEVIVNGKTIKPQLSEEEVTQMTQDVGQKYTKLVETSVGTFLNEYMRRLVKDYNISKLSESAEALQRFVYMCDELEKALGQNG